MVIEVSEMLAGAEFDSTLQHRAVRVHSARAQLLQHLSTAIIENL